MLRPRLTSTYALEAGTNAAEDHAKLNWKNGGSSVSGSVTVDANWKWTHIKGETNNCNDGNLWSDKYCPDAATCGKNCVIEGADYQGAYGVSASGDGLTLTFVTHGQYSTNVGSRLYLLKDEKTYQVFNLIGKEFTFAVDVSNLPYGLNGAFYFVQMDGDDGTSRYPDDNDSFTKHWGFRQLGATLNKGCVVVLSLWDDHDVNMLWLDSVYPTNSNKPGADRGPCETSSGVSADVESQAANSSVKYCGIRFGAVDSTYK